ncbi:hypothetical protein N7507_005005 [Penicillium longicatenatum]|nr:hypothetical protein N7507_005005 [Penicillium longicatenatum]
MRNVYGSDASSQRYRSLIRGANWDIVYTAEHQVDFFTRLNDNYTIRPDAFVAGLKEDFYLDHPLEASVPLAIPSILQRIYDDTVPLGDICKILGYKNYENLKLSGLNAFLAKTKKRKARIGINSSKRRRVNPPILSEAQHNR